MQKLSIQPISKHVSKWGEGPVWWKDHLVYVDIEGHCLNRLNPDNGEVTSWNVREAVGTVVPTSDGKFAYAGSSGFVLFDPRTNTKTPMGNPESTMASAIRFNDGKCDPLGRFWAGSISLKKQEMASTGLITRLMQYLNDKTRKSSLMIRLASVISKLHEFGIDNMVSDINFQAGHLNDEGEL